MSEKRFIVVFTIGVMLLQVLVIGGLHGLGADSETIASTIGLLLGVEALGGGLLFMRYL
ncbi:MAG TPA: hypothetical protein VNN15_02235 [Solirubrobacterales bacterium]|nr:hypothetical protein [Solirubrobacterales bacterium]